MNLAQFSANKEVAFIILLIIGLLIFATLLFFIWGKLKPEANLIELKLRTKSWWTMATVFPGSPWEGRSSRWLHG